MMYWNGGWAWVLLMVPMMLAVWAVIALLALPWWRTDDRRSRSPVEQLDERLAVGQIGVEEYRQRRFELDRDASA